MAYLNAPPVVIGHLESEPEKHEYLQLLGPTPLIPYLSIPQFSHRNSSGPVTRTALAEIFAERLPSPETIRSIFTSISPSNSRFLIFRPGQFARIANSFEDPIRSLFVPDALKPFIVRRKYFDLTGFREFVEGVLRLFHHFAALLSHASIDGGILAGADLDAYVKSQIPKFANLRQLAESDETSIEYYCQCAGELFAFHFDPLHMNRFVAQDLVVSRHFAEFLDLEDSPDSDNPFSFRSFIHWFSLFTQSVGENGMLDRSAFKNCVVGWNFSDAFVDRVFETSKLFDDFLDFGGFFHFVVFKENIESETSARYFFDLFDIDEDGVVGFADIGHFYRSLVSNVDSGLSCFFREVVDQTQASGMGFTVDEFMKSGNHVAVIGILSDVREFGESVTPLQGID
jgi:Ca2+-binding EF-hand superfamily protein